MNCPACRSKTVEQGFEASRGGRVLLDVCPACHGLWFDTHESIQLSSNGVLRLFRQMHGRKEGHHRLREPLPCPRCRAALARANDLARGNRFQYFHCPEGHGHFITFFQFLREKGIVRSLTPKALTELKKHVQLLQCSDCGGAIALERESACPSCRAPVCILDPKALGSAIEDLSPAAAAAGAVVAPAVAAQLLRDRMGMDSFYREVEARAQAASTIGPAPLAIPNSELNNQSAVAKGLEVADAVEVGVDLLELGVDFFLDVASGIGDLF
jgi:Zn-finger nucleic acid-binding protein